MKDSPKLKQQWIVLRCQCVGNDIDGFRLSYDWDGTTFIEKANAKSHGFKTVGSDDFNLGLVIEKSLAAVYWMDENKHEPQEILEEIQEEIGLS